MNTEHGELYPDNARDAARMALAYSDSFGPHFGDDLGRALDWITDLGAMVLNLSDRVASQCFESTAQRDVREACAELRDALGNPVISGTGTQTLQGQTIRMAAERLRGSGEPVAWANVRGNAQATAAQEHANEARTMSREACGDPPDIDRRAEAEAAQEARLDDHAHAEGRKDEREATLAEFAALLPGTYYMDPPDGGSVTVLEQFRRMALDAQRWRAQQERISKAIACELRCEGGGDEILDGRNPNPPECDPRA